ncbi:ninjurin-2 isoform X1 [Drosophila busckii]|uniref:ninjurin-2 isoform X1 n=1 Tax=Drosophila busckii TaxID=30019 RepID=UPI00083F3C64|nr:ninjurin-2 isoform X1 [Drosophila busckii]
MALIEMRANEIPRMNETESLLHSARRTLHLVKMMKAMDANRYATKKTIAQGMLDIALLTANASQLKYILQVGEQHQFYKLMLILISLSIVLQLMVGILFVAIGSLNINKQQDQTAAIILNDVILVVVFVISVVNVIISGFGIEYSSQPLRLVDQHAKTP